MLNPSLVIEPRTRDLGSGFVVRRILPWAKRRQVGPFVFWDHMGPVQLKRGDEMQVRAHPHIGLSTLTYLFSGKIRHRDTLGIIQDIEPGAINWMTAGRGIAHSERTHPEMGSNIVLEGIQIWIALPKEFEEVEPSFVHIAKEEIPSWQHQQHHCILVAGEYMQYKSPVPVYSPLFYLDVLAKEQRPCSLPIPDGHEAALYVAKGEIQVGDQKYREGQMLVWDQVDEITFTNLQHARVLLFGGKTFNEPRHIWWNLVSSRPERIEQAKEDWLHGRFGQVIDESEYIPLPSDSY